MNVFEDESKMNAQYRASRPPRPPLAKGGRGPACAGRFNETRCRVLALVMALGLTGFADLAIAQEKKAVWDPEGVEDFSLTEAHGQTVTKADLLGKPWVACFVFTRCVGPCPLVSEQMQNLQNRL